MASGFEIAAGGRFVGVGVGAGVGLAHLQWKMGVLWRYFCAERGPLEASVDQTTMEYSETPSDCSEGWRHCRF